MLRSCLGHPVPSSLPLWPRVYCPVRSPCFTVGGQDEGQESQTDKVELNFAKLQVHGAAQAGQGECECGRSVQSLQTRMCMTLRNLRTRDMFSSSGTLFHKHLWNFVGI